MALSILDGNQSATTLSTILSSGQHITAHTVVSLGTQAITDMRGAVSGSVVSISNLPSTQTIAGTVTANGLAVGSTVANVFPIGVDTQFSGVRTVTDLIGYRLPISLGDSSAVVSASLSDPLPAGANRIGVVTIGAGTVTLGASTSQIGSVTASISNSLTISSLPAISGTVTANAGSGFSDAVYGGMLTFVDNEGGWAVESLPPISGTVTANINTFPDATTIGEQIAQGFTNYGSFDVAISGTANVSGTVTLGASTSQIGSVTASISNSVTIASFATSVTARLINPAGTAVTYAEVGTAGNPSIDVLSVQGVTSGTPLTILNYQGTTVTTSNFTSTTASTVLASANTGREVLTIFNEGAGNLHICAGATCTTIAYQVRLSAGDYYEVPLNQTSLTHSAVFATAGTARIVQIS